MPRSRSRRGRGEGREGVLTIPVSFAPFPHPLECSPGRTTRHLSPSRMRHWLRRKKRKGAIFRGRIIIVYHLMIFSPSTAEVRVFVRTTVALVHRDPREPREKKMGAGGGGKGSTMLEGSFDFLVEGHASSSGREISLSSVARIRVLSLQTGLSQIYRSPRQTAPSPPPGYVRWFGWLRRGRDGLSERKFSLTSQPL